MYTGKLCLTDNIGAYNFGLLVLKNKMLQGLTTIIVIRGSQSGTSPMVRQTTLFAE